MTITWKSELNLLNDEQLGRIAFADLDSFGYYYYKYHGVGCCVYGHALELDMFNVKQKMSEVFEQLGIMTTVLDPQTPLEKHYQNAFEKIHPFKLINPEIITEIQNEAKRILEERKQRVSEEPEIVTV